MSTFVTEERFERSLARAALKAPEQLAGQRAWRVGPSDERRLKFFFHTNTQSKALALAAVLQARGYEPLARATGAYVAWTASWLDMASWVVTGHTVPLQMTLACLLAWSQEMCELGLPHDCEFEGWLGETPDFLEMNDDYCLQGSPDGTQKLSIYAWNAASEAALVENDVYWVSPGASLGSLEVLQRHADKVRGLMSPSDELSLEGIDVLSGLEQIYLPQAPRAHGDYRTLPKLQSFRCLDAEKLTPALVNNPSLRRMELRRARKLKSLDALDAVQGLEALTLASTPLTSLDGLAQFPGLNELRLGHVLSLKDITAIGQASGLERLEIHKASKVEGFEPIAGLAGLRWVFINDRHGTLSGYDMFRHWPQLQNASVLLRTTHVDFDALAQHPTAAAFLLYTDTGVTLPSEAQLRALLQRHGRQVRSVVLRPKDVCPSVEVTFESDYWRSPAAHRGHARTFVE